MIKPPQYVKDYLIMKKEIAAVVIAMSAFVANAYAAPTVCPVGTSITEAEIANPDKGKGQPAETFQYTATAADGTQWVTNNEYADPGDSKGVEFKAVAIRAKFVACNYESSDGKKAVRLSQRTVTEAKPVGSGWNDKSCTAADPASCKFN